MQVLSDLVSTVWRAIENLFSGTLTITPRPRVREIEHGDLYRAFKKQKEKQNDAEDTD